MPPAFISVERGKAIAEHTLIAFGGAAPLHAARLAEKPRHRSHHRAAQCRGRLGRRLSARARCLRGRPQPPYAALRLRSRGGQCHHRRDARAGGPRGGARRCRIGVTDRAAGGFHAICWPKVMRSSCPCRRAILRAEDAALLRGGLSSGNTSRCSHALFPMRRWRF